MVTSRQPLASGHVRRTVSVIAGAHPLRRQVGGPRDAAAWKTARAASPSSAYLCIASRRRCSPQSLRGLERDGLVSRTAHADSRVEYALTPLGRSMLEPLEAACVWAEEHWEELLDARERHRP